MASPAPDGMFFHSEVHPALTGSWVAHLKQPMAAGLDLLRTRLASCQFAVFDHVTEFDYNGMLTSVRDIAGFRDRAAALQYANQSVEQFVQERLLAGTWKLQDVLPWPANMLPATRNIVPGKIAAQCGFAGLRANEYETCYIRTYLIEADPAHIVDDILSNDFMAEEFARFLVELGEGVARKG